MLVKNKKVAAKEAVIQSSDSWAVKYRPRSLDDFIGQPEIVAMVEGYIARKQMPNAMLITGGTGYGKTTLARIISRTVNEVTGDHDPDCVEANLSEARGIDDMRSIINNAGFMPRKHIRFMLLDELQGATPQALSALLKPLEEPSPRTTWILVTNEPDKLPATIKGRCVKLNLKALNPDDLVPMLARIVKAEKLEVKASVLKKIATNAGAHPRDAIQLLDGIAAMLTGPSYKGESVDILIKAAMKSQAIDGDLNAIKTLLYIYLGRPVTALKTVYESSNKRSLINSMLYINSGVLAEALNVKGAYLSYPQRTFKEEVLKRTGKDSIETDFIITIHQHLADIKVKMFYGIDEDNFVIAEIAKLAKLIKDG